MDAKGAVDEMLFLGTTWSVVVVRALGFKLSSTFAARQVVETAIWILAIYLPMTTKAIAAKSGTEGRIDMTEDQGNNDAQCWEPSRVPR